MQNCVLDFLDSRIDEIMDTLRGSNVEYSSAFEKSRELLNHIDPILRSETDLTMHAEDCDNLREYFKRNSL